MKEIIEKNDEVLKTVIDAYNKLKNRVSMGNIYSITLFTLFLFCK